MPALHSEPQRLAEQAEQDAQIVRLKRAGLTYDEVATQLGISPSSAFRGFHRAIRNTPRPDVEAFRDEQLARIQAMRERITDILERRQMAISHGKVVMHNGEPVLDDSIALQAADRLAKLDDQEAKLLGMYPATRVQADVNVVNYTVNGVDTDALK